MSDSRPVKTQISVYLLKPSVSTDLEALRPEAREARQHQFVADGSQGPLYVKPSTSRVPEWRRLLGANIQPAADDVSESSSAVLILMSGGHRFALTFGHGWAMLDPAAYERRFGLKVALNALDPEQLRGAQARKFGGVAQQTSRQLARLSSVDAFELDWQRDLVTSLDGVTLDGAIGSKMSGRDAVRLAIESDAGDLARICADLYDLSQQNGYRAAYPQIDNIEEVTDPVEIGTLTDALATQLAQRDLAGIDLYPPEFLPDDVVAFDVHHSRRRWSIPEPGTTLLNFPLSRVPQTGTATELASWVHESLLRSSLVGLDAGSDEVDAWTFWDCLTCEISVGGARYIKNGAAWFSVKTTYLQEVDAFIDGLTASGLAYPNWNLGEDEGTYNANTAASEGWALIDKQTISLTGRSPVEPCDLVSDQGHIIHVKKRKYGSGPLSHAIAQATVGADLLKNVQEFRDEFRTRLSAARPGFENLISDSPTQITQQPIVLALITATASGVAVGKGLPFFTKVFLMRNVTSLRNIGYTVYLDEISAT